MTSKPLDRGRALLLTAVLLGASFALLASAAGQPDPEPDEHAQVACSNTSDNQGDPPFCEAATFRVTGPGASPKQVERLGRALGTAGLAMDGHGVIQFMDLERFQRVPTIPADRGEPGEDGMEVTQEAFDLEALEELGVMDGEEAKEKVLKALRRAGLLPDGAAAWTVHSMLEFLPAEEGFEPSAVVPMSFPIDTHVNFDLMLGDLPLVGPGAKLKFAFDDEGMPTQAFYALRGLAPGEPVEVMPPEDGHDACLEVYGLSRGDEPAAASHFEVDSTLAFYAPPLSLETVETIFPHFVCNASLPGEESDIPLRTLIIPAVTAGPSAEIEAFSFFDPETERQRVSAEAMVEGGTPPYTFRWSSLLVTLDPAETTGPSIEYPVTPREFAFGDIVTVQVSDTNGLTTTATAFVSFGKCCFDEAKATEGPELTAAGLQVGTEWIGESQGLGGSSGNAGGWVQENRDEGTTVAFDWGDFSAWEQDFKDPAFEGDDSDWVDDVDMLFYTGHANADGWTFPGNRDDGFLHFTEARYGNTDLEWLVIAACGPLQLTSGGKSWAERWGPAFRGLHMMLAYATVSNDNTVEGRLLASHIHGVSFLGFTFGQLSIRQAWAATATEVQPSSVVYAMMGAVRGDGVTNYNDYFWGKGPVGPDIPLSQTAGYWRLSSTS